MHGGLDLNLETELPTTPSQIETMFPMLETYNKEIKPMQLSMATVPNMNIEGTQQFQNPPFVPNLVKPEIFPTIDGLVSWEVPNGMIGMNKMPFDIGVVGSASGQLQLNGLGNVAEPANFGMGNGGGGFYQQNPYQVFGGFNLGTTTNARIAQAQFDEDTLERRHRRLIKNRESAARSRARRLAFNAQQVIEIEKLKKENDMLRKMIRNLLGTARMRYERVRRGILKTLSAPPPGV